MRYFRIYWLPEDHSPAAAGENQGSALEAKKAASMTTYVRSFEYLSVEDAEAFVGEDLAKMFGPGSLWRTEEVMPEHARCGYFAEGERLPREADETEEDPDVGGYTNDDLCRWPVFAAVIREYVNGYWFECTYGAIDGKDDATGEETLVPGWSIEMLDYDKKPITDPCKSCVLSAYDPFGIIDYAIAAIEEDMRWW